MSARVLVAGVGNVFLGDDGFGVEVVRRLAGRKFPPWVRVADYGIRGMHLAYDLTGGDQELTILVDATSRGDAPGTVSVVELDTTVPSTVPDSTVPDSTGAAPDGPASEFGPARSLDAHGMQPDVVLKLVRMLGGDPGRVLLVGCEPAVLDHRMELSPAVAAAVATGVCAVADLIARYRSDTGAFLIGSGGREGS